MREGGACIESQVDDLGVGERAGRTLPFIFGVGGSEASYVVLERDVGLPFAIGACDFRSFSSMDVIFLTSTLRFATSSVSFLSRS